MSGGNMLILCTLSLLSATSQALSAKDTAPAATPAPAAPAKDLHQEHHDTKEELKKLLQGKSAEEIAALRKKVDTSGTSVAGAVVSKVGSLAATAVSATASAAVSAVTGASWGSCPDGFASQRVVDGCCTSQALRHMKQAKLLCESSDGWKTAQASAESFTCCPPPKAAVAAASAGASSGKEKEVADLKKQVADLKAMLAKDAKAKEKDSKPSEPSAAEKKAKALADLQKQKAELQALLNKDNDAPSKAPSPAVGKVSKEVSHKGTGSAPAPRDSPRHLPKRNHQIEIDEIHSPVVFGSGGAPVMHMEVMSSDGRIMGGDALPPGLDREIEGMMHALEPHPLEHESHTTYILPSHLSQRQANDAFAQAIEEDLVLVDPARPRNGARHHSARNNWQSSDNQSGYEAYHFLILGALALLLYFWFGPGASHKDMRNVQIPGYGNVNTDPFFNNKNEECNDLFESGCNKGNYGGATFKPMKNVGGSDFSNDDLGL